MKKRVYIFIIISLLILIMSGLYFTSIALTWEYDFIYTEEIATYDSDNYYCIDEGYEFKKGTYANFGEAVYEDSDEGKMLAYIAAKGDKTKTGGWASPTQGAVWAVFNSNKHEFGDKTDDRDYYHLVDILNDKWQGSSNVGPSNKISNSKFATLYKDAYNYAKNGGKKEIIIDSKDVKNIPEYKDSKIICGPYKLSSTDNIKISLKDSNCYVSNEEGEKLSTIPNTGIFYITINQDNISTYNKKEIDVFEQEYKTYKLTKNELLINIDNTKFKRGESANSIRDYINAKKEFKSLKSADTGHQNIIHLEGTEKTKTDSVKLTLPTLMVPVTLKLHKTDNAGNNLKGMEFKAEFPNKTLTGTTDENGNITFDKYEPKSFEDFTVKISETKKAGFKKIGEIKLKYHFNGTKWVPSIENATSENASISEDTLNVKNTYVIKFILNKTDSIKEKAMEGVYFTITLSNCKLVSGYAAQNSNQFTIATNTDGKIEIPELEIENVNEEIVITLEETQAPKGYKKLDGQLVIKLKWTEDGLKVVDATTESTDTQMIALAETIKAKEVYKDYEMSIDVKNIPLMTIAGIVFQDNQVISKVTEVDGDGKYTENVDTLLNDIVVKLYKENETENPVEETKTVNGKYEFKDVEAGNYYVEFIYNGMKYQTITAVGYRGNDDTAEKSNAVEEAATRTTINGNQKISGEVSSDFTIKAKVEKIEYQNEATTDATKSINLHVNCGLKERYFDLTLGLDIDSATVNIKGESETYQYNEILSKSDQVTTEDGIEYYKLEQSKAEEYNNKEYSLYLYESDYMYRKKDYEGEGKTNKLNPNEQETINNHEADLGEELSAIVTYKAIVHRQSKAQGYATKLINTYDNNFYTLYAIQDEKGNVIIRGEDNNWYKITDIVSGTAEVLSADSPLNCSITTEGTAKITIPFYESEREGFEENEQQIMLYYQLNKFEENATLNNPVTLEISEYYTQEGIIDYDSIPNNGKDDDYDEAKPLVIERKDTSRTISGNVFEDLEKDGDFNNSDPKIPNILVQLVEILEIGGANYEYIWQEMLTDNNKDSENYGNYEFNNILPGNYIVRFIYGDKAYSVTELYAETEKYNALDYKSTYSNNYNSSLEDIGTDTKAFDNEARRIEQARSVLNKKEEEEETEEAETNWMCADTPKFTVEVDKKNKNENEQNKSASNVILKFENVSFGLMQRPKEEIVLEKHLTKLEIDPFIKSDGSTDGAELVPIPGDRTNRGSWTIQFEDVSAAAGKLRATYSYNVINTGEEDYVFNREGIQKVEDDDPINRKEYSIGNYLAEYYYTGVKGTSDMLTTITVKGVEEIINPLFTATNREKEDSYSYYKENGTLDATQKSTKVTLAQEIKLTGNDSIELGKITLEKDITSGMIAPTAKGLTFRSSIAELTGYTNNGGKRFTTTPKNLTYNNSEYNPLTLDSYAQLDDKKNIEKGNVKGNVISLNEYNGLLDEEKALYTKMNESDECWAEDIILTQNFGEDKQTPVTMILIITASAAVLGVGIILIKKFAIK